MSGPKYIASVHRFLKKLQVPEAKMEKIIGMTVIARSKKPLESKKNKADLTDLDCCHTMLIELNRKSGRTNYVIVFIRPKNDRDNKDDGKPYVMKADMLGKDNWSTDEESDDDETVYGPDNYDRFNTSDFTDDEDDKACDKAGNKADDKANDSGEDTADDFIDELANDNAYDSVAGIADDNADDTADDTADDDANDTVEDTADDSADEAGDDDAGEIARAYEAVDEAIDEGSDEDDEQADDEDGEQADDEDEELGDDHPPEIHDSASEDLAYYTADDAVDSDD